ncbi:MAG: cache domain-containing protein, partial [Methylobacteriaceae bacterium]|nr:cache domain-containing protein [Methylobacteriaceae bacterium]
MRTLSIPKRLGLLVVVAVTASLAMMAAQLLVLKGSLLEARRAALIRQVDAALSVVQALGADAEAGRLTLPQAQERAKAVIRAIRYGQGDYFFAYDYDGNNVVHGLQPKNEGRNFIENKDATGKRFTAEQIELAKKGGGFVTYLFAKPGNPEPAPKLSFVRGYDPWRWELGTGVYIDDLDATFWEHAQQAGLLGLCLIAALVGCAWPLGRGLIRPMKALTGATRAMADGNLEVTVPGDGRTDEVGEMARALRIFRENGLRARALEEEAVRARSEAERERAVNEAHHAARAEQQAAVVEHVARGLWRLSEGDLTGRLTAFPQEFKAIETDFNAAVAKLQDTIRTIAGNSAGIHSGTTEISQAADDLSRRTEQQAASLEETAAALDEITATVRKTAEGADHASRIVATAKAQAERSGAVVGNAVQAMSAIEKSSKAIEQIIGVIDEIAFQTNLLALNAGVEAARAGDAGKGFAVVASEVRGLAQRSADAAREIKTLIGTSTTQVATGVELVGEAGEALATISAQVAELNAIVAAIAASARE